MPRISAPTVAEHRRRQRAALLAAASEVLLDHGPRALTFGVIADKAGLARSTVYEYFPTRDALIVALCEEAFPAWVAEIDEAMAKGTSPREVIAAFVTTQLQMIGDGRHRLGVVLARVEVGTEAVDRIRQLHERIALPLMGALEHAGSKDPMTAAALVQSAVVTAASHIEAGASADVVTATTLGLILDGVAPPTA